MKIGAAVLIIDALDRLLLLKRSDVSHWMPEKWGLPGGIVEVDETAVQAATRETAEETGLQIFNLSSVQQLDTAEIFYTRDYVGTVKIDHEHTAWEWVRIESMDKYETVPGVTKLFGKLIGVY